MIKLKIKTQISVYSQLTYRVRSLYFIFTSLEEREGKRGDGDGGEAKGEKEIGSVRGGGIGGDVMREGERLEEREIKEE